MVDPTSPCDSPPAGDECPAVFEAGPEAVSDATPKATVSYEVDYPVLVEDPNLYGPGGFHPVRLGDQLGDDNRFRVVHKLGDGGWGTVWLCHDKLVGKWRAVKIQAADASKPEDCPELALAQTFAKFSWDELAQHNIGMAMEHFWLDGPNGRHLCSVMPILGPRVAGLFGKYAKCRPLLKDVCAQIVDSLRFLHRNGICHGDLRPANILSRVADGVDELPEEEIMKVLGPPVLVTVSPIGADKLGPGVPKYLVERKSIDYSSGLCSTRVLVTDLGISYRTDNAPEFTGIPLPYAAPENIFGGKPLGPATDIWALGVTIQNICADTFPFANDEDLDAMVRIMEQNIGPMPQPYRPAWAEMYGCKYMHDPNDESQYVVVDIEDFAELKRWREDNRDGITDGILSELVAHPDYLPRLLITQSQADEIAKQDYTHTGALPGYFGAVEDYKLEWNDRIEHQNDRKEMEVLRDLLVRIFKWHPEDRPSLNEIANHEWFEVWYDCK